jgi:hypothetical protein
MVTLLIGHRGVGKTALLERLRRYGPVPPARRLFLEDLDAAIARGERESIESLFASRGEAAFRQLERTYLARVLADANAQDAPAYVAVGAGFEGPMPPGVRVLWIRRDTDAMGRVFLDRPVLDPGVDPIVEYRRRFKERETRFEAWAGETLTIPEGRFEPNSVEEAYFHGTIENVGGAVTVPARAVRDEKTLRAWLRARRDWGVRRFELRDDLLTLEQLETALAILPANRTTFAFRRSPSLFAPRKLEDMLWDWPIELGACPHGVPPVTSLHQRGEGERFADCLARLEAASGAGIRKLAVPVLNFDELEAGHRWATEDPTKRAFLPTSKDGRWAWYRMQFPAPEELAYWREGEGSSPDQPLLFDWLSNRRRRDVFAAVLGDPVSYSWTPVAQDAFFSSRSVSVYRIRVPVEEWSRAFAVLERLGLRWAAVTSPLKAVCAKTFENVDADVERFGAANSLYRAPNGDWFAGLTDGAGLDVALQAIPEGETVVWGAGGLLPLLRERLPQAAFYAARLGAPRERTDRAATAPRSVLWATGVRKPLPPESWRPEVVVDLSYRMDSPGRVYARAVGARYVDGAAMFAAQAEAQRDWWKRRMDAFEER